MKTTIKFSVLSVLLSFLFIAGCGQQINSPVANNDPAKDGTFMSKHGDLPQQTLIELQQAKIATARYHNLNNAIADGYEDINVIIPHMGYHYLKSAYLDSLFEPDKPELLVYSPNPANGNMELVAVEYAVPISFYPNNPPEGFTGDYDVWDTYQGQLWTCHAWIWKYNPDGVFAEYNPDVP
jgi:hypothetical protein